MDLRDITGLVFIAVVLVAAAVVVVPLLPSWVRARRAGVGVRMIELLGMKLRRVPLRVAIDSAIEAHRAGLDVSLAKIETQYLAGGFPLSCVRAMIAGQSRGMRIEWDDVTAADLAEFDIERAVEAGVDPGRLVGTGDRRFKRA